MSDPIWLHWTGYFLPLTTLLLGWLLLFKRKHPPPYMLVLFVLTFALTVWQARWAYFFVAGFGHIDSCRQCLARSEIAFGWLFASLAFLPDSARLGTVLWPNEIRNRARRPNASSKRCSGAAGDSVAIEEHAAISRAVVALRRRLAYWSGQPAVAGSSHESLGGIVESARFFLTTRSRRNRARDPAEAQGRLGPGRRCGADGKIPPPFSASSPRNPLCARPGPYPIPGSAISSARGTKRDRKVYRVTSF